MSDREPAQNGQFRKYMIMKMKPLFLSSCLAVLAVGMGCRNNNNNDNSNISSTNTTTATDVGTPGTTGTNDPGTNAADNTARNRRDQSSNNLTPLDQGNSQADLTLTQQIRKSVVSSTNNYSMTAKNVKIITVNGKVTLRGPVNNTDEKTGIEMIAKNAAGADNVDDELEVKTNQASVNP
jgi:osmotically-inducible protein OsmY